METLLTQMRTCSIMLEVVWKVKWACLSQTPEKNSKIYLCIKSLLEEPLIVNKIRYWLSIDISDSAKPVQ